MAQASAVLPGAQGAGASEGLPEGPGAVAAAEQKHADVKARLHDLEKQVRAWQHSSAACVCVCH